MKPQQPWRKPTVLIPTMRFVYCEMRDVDMLSQNGEYFFCVKEET